jgi:hypothetical protein
MVSHIQPQKAGRKKKAFANKMNSKGFKKYESMPQPEGNPRKKKKKKKKRESRKNRRE